MTKETMWEEDDFYYFAHMTPKRAEKVGLFLFERLRGIVKAAEQDLHLTAILLRSIAAGEFSPVKQSVDSSL